MTSELTMEQIATASQYLSQTRDALVESASGLLESQWKFKQDPERWSIGEIVEHVVLVEQRIHSLVAGMNEDSDRAAEADPEKMDDFILHEVPKRTTKMKAPPQLSPACNWDRGECLSRFLAGRERTMQLLSKPALREYAVPHRIFGPLDGYQWLLAAASHGARHTGQIQEVKADPNFPTRQTSEP